MTLLGGPVRVGLGWVLLQMWGPAARRAVLLLLLVLADC